MNCVFQKRFVVSAIGDKVFKYETFPENKEKEARSCYDDFLARYPNADVEFNKEERSIRCLMGEFLISDDGQYAVNVGDNEFYYTLPNKNMSDNAIKKFLNDIYYSDN